MNIADYRRLLLGLIGALTICFFAGGTQTAHAQSVSDAPIIVRIGAPTQTQVNTLAGMVDVWEVDHAQGIVTARVDEAAIARLRALGYTVTVDAARTANARSAAAPPVAAGAAPPGTIPGYACYRTVDQTYADMQALATAHPRLAQWIDYGDTWDKLQPGGAPGLDLRALVITNRDRSGPKFPFVVIASIHARELATAEVAVRFAEQLVGGYGIDPTVTWLLDYGEVTIVPMANPDGRKIAEQLVYWRKNTHNEGACSAQPNLYSTYGVDLNRNSSFGWGACTAAGCSSTDLCSLTYRGEGPASEPETEALQSYLSTLFADQRGPGMGDAAPADTEGLFISLHSYGELVLYPWGHTGDATPNGPELQALGDRFSAVTGYRVCQAGAPGCLYATDGTTDDWSYGTLGVASYTFEMGTQFFEGCGTFESTIRPDVTEALIYGATAARRPYQWPQGPATISATLTPTRVVEGQPLTLQVTFAPSAPPVGASANFGRGAGIAAANVWLDAPPWSNAAGSPMTLSADPLGSGALAVVTLDTTGWTLGRHTLFWSAQSGAGLDGVPGALFIDVVEVPTADPESPEPRVDGGRVFLPFAAFEATSVHGTR